VRPGWKSVRRRYKDYDLGARREFDANQAKLFLDWANEASEHTDAKVRQLLTLSAALAPVALVLASHAYPRVLGLLVVGMLVVVVLLCVAIIEVRVSVQPTLEQVQQDGSHHKQWAWDLFSSAQANQAIHRLRVDFYSAARRYFIVSFLLTTVAAITTLSSAPGPGRDDLQARLPSAQQPLEPRPVPDSLATDSARHIRPAVPETARVQPDSGRLRH
jgi:hypothetical protein